MGRPFRVRESEQGGSFLGSLGSLAPGGVGRARIWDISQSHWITDMWTEMGRGRRGGGDASRHLSRVEQSARMLHKYTKLGLLCIIL